MSGWIKLHRKFLQWEWFTDVNTCHLFQYLLLEANHHETKWRGHTIMSGQLLTGRKKIAEETGLSERNVRTSLDKLKSTSEVTSRTYNKYSIITICKWKEYQQIDQQPTSNASGNRPATDHIQEEKEFKEDKKVIDLLLKNRFDEFWHIYGYKVGKENCEKIFATRIKSGIKEEEIISGAMRYRKYCDANKIEKKFRKHPSTWLNGSCWKDEHDKPVNKDIGIC